MNNNLTIECNDIFHAEIIGALTLNTTHMQEQ